MKNEWHIVLIPSKVPIDLTVNAPAISGYTCVVLGSAAGLKSGYVWDIRILYAGTVHELPNAPASQYPYKVFVLTYSSCYYYYQ